MNLLEKQLLSVVQKMITHFSKHTVFSCLIQAVKYDGDSNGMSQEIWSTVTSLHVQKCLGMVTVHCPIESRCTHSIE